MSGTCLAFFTLHNLLWCIGLGVTVRVFHIQKVKSNQLFLGLILVIGVGKSTSFFVQPEKLKGSGCFFGGILVVLLGWPIIGMAIEIYGFIALFGGFFPMAINVLRVMPVIGTILALPGISNVCDTIVGQGQ